MSLSPPSQPISDNNLSQTRPQPNLGNSTPFILDNLSNTSRQKSRKVLRERQSVEGDTISPVSMIVSASGSQHQQPILKNASHRPTQSVPPISPTSPTFRHSASSSISRLPLTPETSPRYRPKYGKREGHTIHRATSPLLGSPKDENEPPSSPTYPLYKQKVSFPLRKSEDVEAPKENRDRRTSIPPTFPLSSPPASPPPRRRMRPSLEGVFDTPTPKPRNSAVLTPPDTEEHPTRTAGKKSQKRLPPGENPFFFGRSVHRRSHASDPEPPEAQIDFNLPKTLDTSSVVLQVPALNITSPTPGASPSRSTSGPIPPIPNSPPLPDFSSTGALKPHNKEQSHPKSVTYEDEVQDPRSTKSEEVKKGSPELDTVSIKGSRHLSNTTTSSVPPSAFNTSRRNSRARRLSQSGRMSPSNNFSAITVQSPKPETSTPSPSNTTPERPRTTTPKPSTRAASTRTKSIIADGNSSRSAIPISAYVNPRPPSVGVQRYDFVRKDEGLYMRDPYKDSKSVGWKIRPRGKRIDQIPDQEAGESNEKVELQTPICGLLFYPGFLFPPLWWIASFLNQLSFDQQVASEKKWPPWRVRLAREHDLNAKTWRDRCRLMALVSMVTYLPLIALLAVFIPK